MLIFLGGCGSLEGEVRNAATGRPVVGAVVRISTTGWGRRDGQIVWDAETVHETRSDRTGRFRFDGIDGGGRLQVRSSAGSFDHGSLCPQSPQLVWVGGPNAGLELDRRLVFADALAAQDEDRVFPPALARDFGISASGSAFDQGSALRISARGGLRFVRGTGMVPPAPALPYPKSLDLEFTRECGWLFVSDGTYPIAVIRVGALSGRQEPSGRWIWSMPFAPLPHRGSN